MERTDITEKTFEDRERLFREKADQLTAAERKDNFSEVVYGGYTEEQAVREASRCLECGCHDFFECKLIELSNQYGVKSDRFHGEKKMTKIEDDHPFIVRDSDKCILCGLCVRVCDEVMGVGALGLVDRGFDTVVAPTLGLPLAESGCESCGQCVTCCPVGALQERQTVQKEVPVDTQLTETTCSYCSVGCSLDLESYGDMLVKANPSKEGAVNKGICCGKGKWGFDASILEDKIVDPMVKDENGNFRLTDYHEAFVMMAKKLESVALKNGRSSIGVAVSDRYTNEEAYAIKKFADSIGAATFTFNRRQSGVRKVLGLPYEASPNTIDELLSTDVILVPGFIKKKNPVIWNKIKQAAEAGAKIIVVTTQGAEDAWKFAWKVVETPNDTAFLKKIAKALVNMGKSTDAKGFEEFKKSLDDVTLCDTCEEVAQLYADAKKAMIVYQQNILSQEAGALIAEIAVLSGHIGRPRDGILEVKPKNNSQGLLDLGIEAGAETLKSLKGLIIFGEDPKNVDFSGLEFLGVSDIFMTDTAKKADVFIPGTGFASTCGTYTNTERRLLPVEAAIEEEVDFNNWEIAAELAHVFEVEFDFEDEYDISVEMNDAVPPYKYAEEGEVLGGQLENLTDRKSVV